VSESTPRVRQAHTAYTAPHCDRCSALLRVTYDALQRPRLRCPRCDGAAPARVPHLDDADARKIPSTAVIVYRGVEYRLMTCVGCGLRMIRRNERGRPRSGCGTHGICAKRGATP
jgi:hypothetical protein